MVAKKLSILLIILALTSCNNDKSVDQNHATKVNPTSIEKRKVDNLLDFDNHQADSLPNEILSILQDKRGNYWFGCQRSGVYRYDGEQLIQFTTKNGLPQNQVQEIQEDESGNIWFSTGGFGIARFDGRVITSIKLNKSSKSKWDENRVELLFNAGSGVFSFDDSLSYLPFPNSTGKPYEIGPFSVYAMQKGRKGDWWFGTQSKGVCSYDQGKFTWLTEKGLAGPAVLAVFEDKQGNQWFGTNGGGVFRYDGTALTNLTQEKGLTNPDFVKTGKQGPGTLARVWAINQTAAGNLIFGTGEGEIWTYDGEHLTKFTTATGLPGDPIEVIFKDHSNKIWIGTNGGGVYSFDGNRFEKFLP